VISGLTFIVPRERPERVAKRIAAHVLADSEIEMTVVDAEVCRFASRNGTIRFTIVLQKDKYGTLVELSGFFGEHGPQAIARSVEGVTAPPPLGSASPVRRDDGRPGDTRVIRPGDTRHVERVQRVFSVVLDSGVKIPLDTRVVFGRDPGPLSAKPEQEVRLIRVPDPGSTVSKSHFAADVRDGRVWVEDLASTNGTMIRSSDGVLSTLLPHQPVPVGAGASVVFGEREASISSG
jgi:hypothetical protein